jgi:hypothetical protein
MYDQVKQYPDNGLDKTGLFLPFLALRQELRGSAKPGG